jgi:hypothetical protein
MPVVTPNQPCRAVSMRGPETLAPFNLVPYMNSKKGSVAAAHQFCEARCHAVR